MNRSETEALYDKTADSYKRAELKGRESNFFATKMKILDKELARQGEP